ncbi:MAG: HU family DNA-binding protein [Anaerolineales bacterium]|nr:HU family DNA-binding protein [Anaerolineales bacterium]
MAPRIKAVNAYRPRIEQGNTVQKPELIRAVSRATSLVEGTVDQTVKEVRDQIIEFCRAGRAVKVDGLGTFTPSIDLEGYFAISFRADPAMNHGLNLPGTFSGTIINREFIGKTSDELVAKWNEDHSDDQVNIVD